MADYYSEVECDGGTTGQFLAIVNKSTGVIPPSAYWNSLRLSSPGSARIRIKAERFSSAATGGVLSTVYKFLISAAASVCEFRSGDVSWPNSSADFSMTFAIDTAVDRLYVPEFPIVVASQSTLVLSLVDAQPGQTLAFGVSVSV